MIFITKIFLKCREISTLHTMRNGKVLEKRVLRGAVVYMSHKVVLHGTLGPV